MLNGIVPAMELRLMTASPSVAWRLRPALPPDAPALQRACLPYQPLEYVQNLLQRCQQAALNRHGLGLVAVLPDGGVIGFGQLTIWPHRAEISDLIVGEMWRGQGIGSALITRLLNAAREMAVTEAEIGVSLGNRRARALYHRLGFRDHRTITLDLGSGPESILYLTMTLSAQSDTE